MGFSAYSCDQFNTGDYEHVASGKVNRILPSILNNILPFGQEYLNTIRSKAMKRYLLQIKMKANNKDLIGYLRNRGITLIVIDPWIEDSIIIETTKSIDELSDFQYISSIRELN